ncbi:MAG: DUF4097 family beta strand repeat protein [Acidobacteriota bacterium]|nr:MAG: DUF4097 family beta strand repeat protein [Acidobacteriota bacterium]
MNWLFTFVISSLVASSGVEVGSIFDRTTGETCTPTAVHSAVQDETVRFEQTYPISANGTVTIGNINGAITVESWDRNEVKLSYVVTADSRESLELVVIKIDSRADLFRVKTEYKKTDNEPGSWKQGRRMNVEYKVMAPRGAVLRGIDTVNGEVRISNFTNQITAAAVNGKVVASDLKGTAKLSTVNGEVSAEFNQLDATSSISLETVNGRVALTLPSDTNATITADSVNGTITNEFGLSIRKGKFVGRDMRGRIGSGDARVKLSSVNGPLSINRKKDGKQQFPAVDLLPQGGSDNEEWSSTNMARVNAELAKATKKMTEELNAEMKKLAPELKKVTAEAAKTAEQALRSEAVIEAMKNVEIMQSAALARIADAGFTAGVPRLETKSGKFPLENNKKLTIIAEKAAVSVKGWDRNEVEYRVISVGDPRSSENIGVNENLTPEGAVLTIVGPASSAGTPGFSSVRRGTRVEISIPRNIDLTVNSANEIRVTGFRGKMHLSGSAEGVSVRDSEGELAVNSRSGRIRVVGFTGSVTAENADGVIMIDGDLSELNAKSPNGDVVLTLPQAVSADIETRDEVRGDGFELRRIGSDKFRLGNGGARYLVASGGEVVIRSRASLGLSSN